ncbi:hypothetical protein Q4485_14825 [Granulosicoccaceae sp. 1_MG-2023]|nr:hypothetical protein [Granulosicoccaceae sp. 1_MG-2023]
MTAKGLPAVLLQLLGIVAEADEKLAGGASAVPDAPLNRERLLRLLIDRSFPLSLEAMQRIRDEIHSGSERGAVLKDDWQAYLTLMKSQQLTMTEVATAAAGDVLEALRAEEHMPASTKLLRRWIAAFETRYARLAHDEAFSRDYARLFGLAIRLTRYAPEQAHA